MSFIRSLQIVEQVSNFGEKISLKEVKVSLRATPHGTTPLAAPNAVTSTNVSYKTRSRKRRAEPEPETPRKRHKREAPTSKPTNVSNSGQSKRKASPEVDSPSKRRRLETSSFQVNTCRDDFKKKYEMLHKIGEGGFGCVHAGIRIADSLPVAIKTISGPEVDHDIKMKRIPTEVALLQRAAGGAETIGKHAAVSLLDWYYLEGELLIVMERPTSAVNLSQYFLDHSCLEESTTKDFISQMVDAAIDMNHKGVFHRDFKFANILVEDGPVPRLRIVDFGCGSFDDRKCFRSYSGTSALAPPEWLTRKKYSAEPATVWQLGALMYRMLHRRLFNTTRFLKGELKFSETKSPDSLDFLLKCLAPESRRATLEQLRLHPWLQ